MHLILNTSQQVYNSQRSAIVKWQVSLIKPSSVRNLFRDFNCTSSSVSVKVKKDDVYFLKSWPRIWTSLIANGNHTEKSGCFQHFVRTSKTTVWPIKQMMPVLSSQLSSNDCTDHVHCRWEDETTRESTGHLPPLPTMTRPRKQSH